MRNGGIKSIEVTASGVSGIYDGSAIVFENHASTKNTNDIKYLFKNPLLDEWPT